MRVDDPRTVGCSKSALGRVKHASADCLAIVAGRGGTRTTGMNVSSRRRPNALTTKLTRRSLRGCKYSATPQCAFAAVLDQSHRGAGRHGVDWEKGRSSGLAKDHPNDALRWACASKSLPQHAPIVLQRSPHAALLRVRPKARNFPMHPRGRTM